MEMKKTKEQIDAEEQKFYVLQKEYLNGNESKLWEMYPIIKSCIGSCIKKRAQHRFISNFEDIVEDITLIVIERYKNKTIPEGGYQYLKAMADQASKNYYLPKYRETMSYEQLCTDTNKDFYLDDDGSIHSFRSFSATHLDHNMLQE